jgi:hypothetical protein
MRSDPVALGPSFSIRMSRHFPSKGILAHSSAFDIFKIAKS